MNPATLFTSLFGLFLLPICFAQSVSTLVDLPGKFTLAAVNTTLPNLNSTGAPLVLGQDGSTRGITFHATSTYASFPYNEFPTLGLVDGTLRAYEPKGDWTTNATEIKSGDKMGWITTILYQSPAPKIYSVQESPAHQYPVLAVHGNANLWSLCPFPQYRYQTTIIYNVTANIGSPSKLPYDPATCYPVTINVIPV